MQYLKQLLFVLITLFSLGAVYGQQPTKLEAKAAEKVAQFDQEIQAGDAEQSLSDDQKKAMSDILVMMYRDVRKVKKAGGEADAIKAEQKVVRKAAFKRINAEVLTKEQRQARRAGKARKE